MAFSANVTLEVRPSGSATNGGGYIPGSSGTDYSQQDAAQYALTNGTTNATTTIATVSAAAVMVGNLAYIAGGSGSLAAVWKQIVSVVVGVSITVDSSSGLAASSGVTINVGGGLNSISSAQTAWFSGGSTSTRITYVKQGTYTGGAAFETSGASGIFIGYNTNRTQTNTDTKPILQASGGTFTMLTSNANSQLWRNFTFDANSKSTVKLLNSNNATHFDGCYFTGGFTFINNISTPVYTNCYSDGAILEGGLYYGCEVNGAGLGLGGTGVCSFFNCLIYGGGRFFMLGAGGLCVNCSVYGTSGSTNVGAGFDATGSSTGNFEFINCYAENCATNGFWSTSPRSTYYNCGGYNNSSGLFQTAAGQTFGTIVPTGSVFVDAANGNFALNNITNRGALLRGAGYTSLFPHGLTHSYADVGAAQSRAPFGALTFGGGISG